VLINSKEDAFDLPVLVLDEVQTLSAVCEERYRVSLPMRRARAFPHESKTFGERERERTEDASMAWRLPHELARSIDALPPTPPTTPCAAPARTGTRNCPRLGVRRRRSLASRGTTQRDGVSEARGLG